MVLLQNSIMSYDRKMEVVLWGLCCGNTPTWILQGGGRVYVLKVKYQLWLGDKILYFTLVGTAIEE